MKTAQRADDLLRHLVEAGKEMTARVAEQMVSSGNELRTAMIECLSHDPGLLIGNFELVGDLEFRLEASNDTALHLVVARHCKCGALMEKKCLARTANGRWVSATAAIGQWLLTVSKCNRCAALECLPRWARPLFHLSRRWHRIADIVARAWRLGR